MDKFLYVAMSGATETLRAEAVNNHNIANATTTGFRADLSAFQSQSVVGAGFPSRTYATDESTGWKQDSGPLTATGRELDIAVEGKGWIAVQDPQSSGEAYTRAGDLHVDTENQLRTATGLAVMGDSGPLSVPPNSSLTIASDGSISIVPLGQSPSTTATVGRIKLVNPAAGDVVRGSDGLVRMRDGSAAPSDPTTQIAVGTLESSNVDIGDSMAQMIDLSRHFELQIKAIHAAEETGAASAQLLSAN
jgi:flagellar basal-body rod protein FlgF